MQYVDLNSERVGCKNEAAGAVELSVPLKSYIAVDFSNPIGFILSGSIIFKAYVLSIETVHRQEKGAFLTSIPSLYKSLCRFVVLWFDCMGSIYCVHLHTK